MSDHTSHAASHEAKPSATSNTSATPPSSASDPNVNYFGLTNFRNQYRKFGVKVDDRLRHVYVIGKSGMGKSTLLESMVINDIYAGHGVGVIDPHGDLADNILRYIPEHRVKDVIYFNPSDLDFPIGFNILETVPKKQVDRIAGGITQLFKKIWPDVWSPRMDYILNNTILALLEFPGATLMSVNRMFADDDYRDQVINNLQNPAVKAFWTKEFASYNDKYKQEAVAPIQNKVGQFLAASLIRNIVAQTKSTFTIRDIMDGRKIFIVNLSKGLIGEDNSKLLGGMLVTKLYTSAMERVDIPVKERKPFFLYVDEFQNFATESFADILSEARKYGLSLTMAHQYMKQLDEKVLDAVIGNVGTMMSFRIGSGDSEILAKEFAPTFVEEDFLNLPKYQIYLKLLIDGVASSPFSAQTIPPSVQTTPFKEASLQYSRDHYTAKRETIERQVLEWSGMLTLDPETAAHLGEIDEDHDGVPDFLQFKNKQGAKNNSMPAHRNGPNGDRRKDGPRRSDTAGAPRRDDTRVRMSPGNGNREREARPPRDAAQKVLLGNPGQKGISLTSILPKKEPVPEKMPRETTHDRIPTPQREQSVPRPPMREGQNSPPRMPNQPRPREVPQVNPQAPAPARMPQPMRPPAPRMMPPRPVAPPARPAVPPVPTRPPKPAAPEHQESTAPAPQAFNPNEQASLPHQS